MIYHKNYSHSSIHTATATMATSALSQTKPVLIQRTCPLCTCHRRVFAPGYTWFDFFRRLAT